MPVITADELSGTALSGVFAPAYWGFVVSLVLGGITVVQGYIYFPHPKDKLIIQITAGTMLVLDLAATILVGQFIYYYLSPHDGILPTLDEFTPELSVECLISNIIMFIAQAYFVHQLYCMKRMGGKGSWLMIGLIVVFTLVAFVGGFGCVVTMFNLRHGLLGNRSRAFVVFFSIAKGFGTLTDIFATVAMCLFLASSKSSIAQTNSLLTSLMQFVLQRGALVTLSQTMFLVTFLAWPKQLYWLVFHANTTKLYVNTFFAMLNARDQLKAKHAVLMSGMNRESKFGSEHLDLSTVESGSRHEKKFMPTITTSVYTAAD